MKILTLEQILKEDINSFIEWGTEMIPKKTFIMIIQRQFIRNNNLK